MPGMLDALNQVFSRHGVNIASQYLQTEGELGYVVVEADGCGGDAEAVLEEMKAISGTIRARLVYAS